MSLEKYKGPQRITLDHGDFQAEQNAVLTHGYPIDLWRRDQIAELCHQKGIAIDWKRIWYLVFAATEPQHPQAAKAKEMAKSLLEVIGQDKFDEIVRKPPPQELVDYIISSQQKLGLYAPFLDGITKEVLAGRLKWEDRFAAAGIPRPEVLLKQYKQIGKPPNLLQRLAQRFRT